MSLFSEIEKSIERAFRLWTSQTFGAVKSDDLVLIHRSILEDVESKVQTLARGQRTFPYTRVIVTMAADTAKRRELLAAAFGERLEKDIQSALLATHCAVPRGVAVELRVVETALMPIEVEYSTEPASVAEPPAASGRLIVVKGQAEREEYRLERPRTNIGRLPELTDADHRVVRRNDVVFQEGADEVSGTVSRKHAHIRLGQGEYRLCDDGSEFGTRVFREGRSIEVPKGERRGEKLRAGDEIYFGRACVRFER